MVIFKDEALINYYNNDEQRLIKPFFIQRIIDSGLYLIIFPSGLLMLIGFTPLSIHYQLQLNIKKDEPIIDFSYCISYNYQNHCVWMLDEKL